MNGRCVCKMRMPVLMRRHDGDHTAIKRTITFRTDEGKLVDKEIHSDKQFDKYEIGEDYVLAG